MLLGIGSKVKSAALRACLLLPNELNGKWYKPLFDKVKSNQVVRGNAGTFPIRQTNMTDRNFRHYLFVGDVGEQPLRLKHIFPYKNKTSMSDFDYTSVGFTKKK